MSMNEDTYAEKKKDKMFAEWGYIPKMEVYKCLTDDEIFTPMICLLESELIYKDLTIDKRRFLAHNKMLKDNKIKTLLMFFIGTKLYYEWLSDMIHDGSVDVGDDSVSFPKNKLKLIDFGLPDEES